MKITSSQFIKTPGAYQDAAQREPVVITKHDREHTVLMSAREYQRLKRRDRQVFRVGELSERDVAAIAATETSTEAADFDHELQDKGVKLRLSFNAFYVSSEAWSLRRMRTAEWPSSASTMSALEARGPEEHELI